MSAQTGTEIIALSGADAEELAEVYPCGIIETPASPIPKWAAVAQHLGGVGLNEDYGRNVAPQDGTGYNALSEAQLEKLL